MIKAEAISHEGTPGPNWLDRCRTVITPTNITVILLLVIGAALFVGLENKQSQTANQQPKTTPTIQTSASPLVPLAVQPLSTESSTDASGNANIQSAAGGLSSSAAAQSTNANDLGATPTPSLNNAKSPTNAKSQASQQSSQTLLNAQTLTNTVQSTVQSVNRATNQAQSTGRNLLNNVGL